MIRDKKINIYIDWANLHRAAEELGFRIDYQSFHTWLADKYRALNPILFIGYISGFEDRYRYLKKCGFTLIFKPTVSDSFGRPKGNCDTELVLRVVSDFYEHRLDECIIVSGDGDFICLVEFLLNKNVSTTVLAPHSGRCSSFLKRSKATLSFMDEHYHKFSSLAKNEKAPDEDRTS